MEKIKKYTKTIQKAKTKEDVKKIVNELFHDLTIDDIDFNEIIYNDVIPKLKKIGVNMDYNEETSETNYERVIKENY